MTLAKAPLADSYMQKHTVNPNAELNLCTCLSSPSVHSHLAGSDDGPLQLRQQDPGRAAVGEPHDVGHVERGEVEVELAKCTGTCSLAKWSSAAAAVQWQCGWEMADASCQEGHFGFRLR